MVAAFLAVKRGSLEWRPVRGVPVATKESTGIEGRADGKGPGKRGTFFIRPAGQNKTRWGGGGEFEGRGKPLSRQQRGFPSPHEKGN